MEIVRCYNDEYDVKVYYEDARMRHWFGKSGREKLMGAGSVRRDSQIWETFCKELDIPFVAVAPKDNMTKLDAKAFGRDAAMLVFKRRMNDNI